MDFIDLKTPKKSIEKEKSLACPGTSPDREEYPWGTRFTLNEDAISKGGSMFDDVDAEDEVVITARAKIVSKRSNSNDSVGTDGKKKKDRSLEFQIQQVNVSHKGPLEKGTMEDFVKARAPKRK